MVLCWHPHLSFLSGIMLLCLISCTSASDSPRQPSPVPPSPTAPAATPSSPSPSPEPSKSQSFTSTPTPAATIAATIYRIDNRCENFVSEKVALPATKSVEAAVGKVLQQQDNTEFSLAGYRVTIDPAGIATIDLRVSPESHRKLVSLSSCEQMALFGSLRKTLLENSSWKIKDVRFSSQGKILQF